MDGNTLRERTRGPGLYRADAEPFPALAELYRAIATGQTARLRTAADDSLYQSFNATFHAINCGEAVWPRSVAFYQADVARSARLYPLTGGMPANITPCAFWPFKPAKPVRLADHGPANILLVQNLRDPATPYEGALRMRKALGVQRTGMITVDAGGHASYLTTPNKCSDAAATAFLLGGPLPRDLRCPSDGR
ncbi:alpha/beta hydrolase [Kribbella flavida]|uniref:alpha/beta hydrolase n=1 Tax=Kribbella flavida TaxID=182640 RepID=UPI00019BD717|nr:alpha/beta hydrolase [Kribbella flavida]